MLARAFIRQLTTSKTLIKNHYEVLGIGPNATASEVKAAYYKKSMELHPDRLRGSKEQFEEVTAAYKALSDDACRKSYDKNFNVGKSGRNLNQNSRTGYCKQGQIYNFDSWTKCHYNDTTERREKSKLSAKNCAVQGADRENVVLAMFVISLICVLVTVFHRKDR